MGEDRSWGSGLSELGRIVGGLKEATRSSDEMEVVQVDTKSKLEERKCVLSHRAYRLDSTLIWKRNG